MDIISTTNVVFVERRISIESTLIQRHYFESALTQCHFIATCPAEVKINIDIVSNFEYNLP